MKPNFAAIIFFGIFLSSAAFGQQTKLEGHVYEILNGKETPVAGVRIIAPGGQSRETDSKGHFTIDFATTIQPGQATRIEVVKSGWVIYEPLFGNCVTQSTVRNGEPLKVIIVEKRSPLALSPKRLSQVISQWSNEHVRLSGRVKEQRRELDEYAFLREYAEKYGYTLEQFKQAADQWASAKDSEDKEEQALKEYWRKNYDAAARLAGEFALVADIELERDNQKKLEDSRKVIRRFELQGNALFAQYKFREALDAYNEIEVRFSTRKLSKEDLLEEWAATKYLLGNARSELGTRVEEQESRLLLGEAVTAYCEALKVYTREQWPQRWAVTQNNLAKAYALLKNWTNAASGFENILNLDPTHKQSYQSLTLIYHERLFEFAKAFELHQRWLSRFSQETSVLPDFAETHFTTGRFAEFSQRVKPLLADPELSDSTKIALQMIEIANLLALGIVIQVPDTLTTLHKTVAGQKADFRINRTFDGVLHFINQEEKCASHRTWLNQFFRIAQEENRNAFLKALREAQAQFPK